METRQKVSKPKAEEEFIKAVMDAVEKYYCSLLIRKFREDIRNLE